MARLLPDTSFWITRIHASGYDYALRQALRDRALYLSSVVAYELHLGTRSAAEGAAVTRLAQAFEAAQRTVVPTFGDWCKAAVLLTRYGRQRGQLDALMHVMDMLILLSAARIRARVVTDNHDDFTRWNAMLPRHRRVGIESVAIG